MTTLVSFFYLLAAICFILALKGLASPATARRGNWLGIFGMAVAIGATLLMPGMHNHAFLLGLILAGGAIGTFIALKINMTAIPQLVAGFHSLVGMAAVLVAFCAFLSPNSFNIGSVGAIEHRTHHWCYYLLRIGHCLFKITGAGLRKTTAI